MKKAVILFLLVLLFFSFTSSFVSAKGLVPCGNIGQDPCTLCDVFVLGNNVVNLLLFTIVPVIAALLIVVGGLMMIWAYAGEGGPGTIENAKKLLTSVIVGIIIIYCAWAIVNLFLMALGVSKWGGLSEWWVITC